MRSRKEDNMSGKQSKNSSYALGALLIILGIFMLIVQFGYVNWGKFWPFILIIGGTLFFFGFFLNRKNFGLIMPGTILFIIGVLFLYTSHSHWHYMEELWPTFILAPGVGLLLMFLFGPKGNAFWIPGSILVTLALIFYARFWYFFRYWPIVLILVGLYLIFSGFGKNEHTEPEDPVDFTGN